MALMIRRLALAIGLAVGLLATQAPEFAQQYRQRLAGAIDELTRMVANFDAEARGHGLSPDVAIQRLETNPDPLARERGEDMASDKSRLTRLQDAFVSLKNAEPVRRVIGFLETFDTATARAAWKDYEPAVPTTGEALIIGLLGLVAGWAATHLLAWPVHRHLARRRERRQTGEMA